MKQNKWTPSQQKALDIRGSNLLVSAGAGSGKTTVLTQRILERIMAGESIADFLVVTFTKASARDLKNKLYDKITKLSVEHPTEKHYRNQTYELATAHISTIHSYCLEMVRANFQTLGLSPKLRMADDQESKTIATEVMELVIDAFYESGDEGFLLLVDTFSGVKDDNPLSATMLKLYDDLRAYSDYFGWLKTHTQTMLASAEALRNGQDFFATEIGGGIRERLRDWFGDLADGARELYTYATVHTTDPSPLECSFQWQECTRDLAEAAGGSYRDFLQAAQVYRTTSFAQMRFSKNTPAEIKEHMTGERKRIKEECDRLLGIFASFTREQVAEQFHKMGQVLEAVGKFLQRFEELFMLTKREKGILDFHDTEHFLYKLLEKDGEPTPLCLSLREQIKEIYIDEYQDVSPLQDRLFTLLSKGNNRFMVGDVKQSIYRFRNAYPDIFLGYKDQYGDEVGESEHGTRVFLRENFRSGQGVIDFTNLLFRQITHSTPYEKEYRGEELIFQKKTTAPKKPVTVAVALSEERGIGPAVEQEAKFIAAEIQNLVENGYCETEEGQRPCRYKDIAILFRTLKNKTAPYERALKEAGIPYTVTTPERFFDRPEVQLMVALLKAVDDPGDDVSLFASLRSPIFGFDDALLYAIRSACGRGSLYRALQQGAETEGPPAEKCKDALSFLSRLRESAEGSSCHAFLWKAYTESGLLHLCTRKEKSGLLMLYEYARNFENTGFKGLSGFITYLKTAEEKDVELPSFSESGEGDCVTLITIHKSKGLEYPVVFYSGTGQMLFPPMPKSYTLLRDHGLFFKLRDYQRLTVTNPMPNLYGSMLERDAEFGEELRKLYVACTRAKEKLYLTGAVTRTAYEAKRFDRRAPSTMLELILYAAHQSPEDPSFELIEISPTETIAYGGALPLAEPQDRFLTDEVLRALTFSYPQMQDDLPAKVSVSYLKETLTGAEMEYATSRITRAPRFLQKTQKTDYAMCGTANHVFMQFCDFDSVDANGISVEADRLVRLRMMEQAQRELLDEKGLEAFFRGELYRRMRRSKELRREMRFSVQAEASLFREGAEGTVLLQGVIDCFFRDENGRLHIVDYKTDRVEDPTELLERHKKQLELYAVAVEKITGCTVKQTSIWSFYKNQEIVFSGFLR